MYILCGIVEHGLQINQKLSLMRFNVVIWSKLDIDGNPIYREDGKVMKGSNYFKPEILKILGKNNFFAKKSDFCEEIAFLIYKL
jgi:hypothetical protein